MPRVSANGIEIEYESFGDEGGEPLLLIMGLAFLASGVTLAAGFYLFRVAGERLVARLRRRLFGGLRARHDVIALAETAVQAGRQQREWTHDWGHRARVCRLVV